MGTNLGNKKEVYATVALWQANDLDTNSKKKASGSLQFTEDKSKYPCTLFSNDEGLTLVVSQKLGEGKWERVGTISVTPKQKDSLVAVGEGTLDDELVTVFFYSNESENPNAPTYRGQVFRKESNVKNTKPVIGKVKPVVKNSDNFEYPEF
jgi:hypothetical protein